MKRTIVIFRVLIVLAAVAFGVVATALLASGSVTAIPGGITILRVAWPLLSTMLAVALFMAAT